MKWLILFLPLFVFAQDKALDSTKKAYQLDWGTMPPGNMWLAGGWSERKQQTYKLTATERSAIEATANAAMYRKVALWSWLAAGIACVGSYLMKAREGLGVALICGAFSFASTFMAQTVHFWLRIGVCAAIGIAIVICFIPSVRDWSVSHIFKKRKEA